MKYKRPKAIRYQTERLIRSHRVVKEWDAALECVDDSIRQHGHCLSKKDAEMNAFIQNAKTYVSAMALWMTNNKFRTEEHRKSLCTLLKLQESGKAAKHTDVSSGILYSATIQRVINAVEKG